MEFSLTVTVASHGLDVENGERFLDGFVSVHPETGPVVDQDLETGEISVTFTFDADSFEEAAHIGAAIFNAGASASGLAPSDFIGANMTVVHPEHDGDRELQLA